jgi:hypothetical protein
MFSQGFHAIGDEEEHRRKEEMSVSDQQQQQQQQQQATKQQRHQFDDHSSSSFSSLRQQFHVWKVSVANAEKALLRLCRRFQVPVPILRVPATVVIQSEHPLSSSASSGIGIHSQQQAPRAIALSGEDLDLIDSLTLYDEHSVAFVPLQSFHVSQPLSEIQMSWEIPKATVFQQNYSRLAVNVREKVSATERQRERAFPPVNQLSFVSLVGH